MESRLNKKILVVDDESYNLERIVQIVEQGEEAYDILQTLDAEFALSIALEEQPDLIITDWEMPGMDGIAFIKKLKEYPTTKDIPVIMCSGVMTSSNSLKVALEAGAIDFIRKPIDKVELSSRIRSMLLLSSSYKDNLDLKDRELASTALSIVKANEYNQSILKTVKDLSSRFAVLDEDLARELDALSATISSKIRGDAWEQFESYFMNVHPAFIQQLVLKFPNLTPNDIKLAALLRLNLTTKDIADVTFISPDSIKTARHRLRRKLGLPSGDNITAFLLKI